MSLLIDLQAHGHNWSKPCWRTSGRKVVVRIPGADDVDWFRRCKSCNGIGGAFSGRSGEASSCALRAPTSASEAEVA
jgi:hypothetical protein